jgi:hypothetical protein
MYHKEMQKLALTLTKQATQICSGAKLLLVSLCWCYYFFIALRVGSAFGTVNKNI